MDTIIPYTLGIIAALVLLFLAFREINAWYWKVNDRLKLMERQAVSLHKIDLRLEKLVNHLIQSQKQITEDFESSVDVANETDSHCPACGNPVNSNDQFCQFCGHNLTTNT